MGLKRSKSRVYREGGDKFHQAILGKFKEKEKLGRPSRNNNVGFGWGSMLDAAKVRYRLLEMKAGFAMTGKVNCRKQFECRRNLTKRRQWGNPLEVTIARLDGVCPKCHAHKWDDFPFDVNGNAMWCQRCGWSYCPESEL